MDGPTAWYPSPSPVANVSQVSVRSKLQALLMMLYSQSGVVDPAALEAKLQALLTLPDSVLAQLMDHPDLADLNKTLDAVFQGTTDLSGVKTELGQNRCHLGADTIREDRCRQSKWHAGIHRAYVCRPE